VQLEGSCGCRCCGHPFIAKTSSGINTPAWIRKRKLQISRLCRRSMKPLQVLQSHHLAILQRCCQVDNCRGTKLAQFVYEKHILASCDSILPTLVRALQQLTLATLATCARPGPLLSPASILSSDLLKQALLPKTAYRLRSPMPHPPYPSHLPPPLLLSTSSPLPQPYLPNPSGPFPLSTFFFSSRSPVGLPRPQVRGDLCPSGSCRCPGCEPSVTPHGVCCWGRSCEAVCCCPRSCAWSPPGRRSACLWPGACAKGPGDLRGGSCFEGRGWAGNTTASCQGKLVCIAGVKWHNAPGQWPQRDGHF
jgi:hypothetical protein